MEGGEGGGGGDRKPMCFPSSLSPEGLGQGIFSVGSIIILRRPASLFDVRIGIKRGLFVAELQL